jgi:cysteine synthase A
MGCWFVAKGENAQECTTEEGLPQIAASNATEEGLPQIAASEYEGYRFIAVMPAKYSLDKQILLRYMGAELYLTGMISCTKSWYHLACIFSFK